MGGRTERLRTGVIGAETRLTLELRWAIAGDALGRARPDLSIGASGGAATLCWQVEVRRTGHGLRIGQAEATLQDASGASCRIEQAATPADAHAVEDGDLLHVDLPGVLVATVRTSPGRARVLYARTAILERLGLAPGAYEPRDCAIEHEPVVIDTRGVARSSGA